MHSTVIPDWAINLRESRGDPVGQLPFVPQKFAHIVVDVQNGFMPGGAIPVPTHPAVVPNVNQISAAVRQSQGLNIFMRFTYDADWRAYYGRFSAAREEQLKDAFSVGAPQHELFTDLDVRGGDLILDKSRFSSFTPGTSDLDSVLKSRGIDTLVVTGCTSNCCCESTVRDAMQMNYNVIFVQDACAAMSDGEHNGAVANIYGIFGCDVATTTEVVERVKLAK
jgi:ureidoacrylate peracid hydrolase